MQGPVFLIHKIPLSACLPLPLLKLNVLTSAVSLYNVLQITSTNHHYIAFIYVQFINGRTKEPTWNEEFTFNIKQPPSQSLQVNKHDHSFSHLFAHTYSMEGTIARF